MMFRLSARRVTVYTAVGLFCLILLYVRNSTQYLDDKQPSDFTEHDHTYLFFDPRASAPKSRGLEEKGNPAGRPARHEEPRREKSHTRDSGRTPIRFHRAHQKNSTPVALRGKTGKTTVVTTPEAAKDFTVATTVRPSSCDGCFQTDFPVLTDQPGVCREVMEGISATASSSAAAAIDIVFLIVSARRNFAQRRAVRGTWASVTRNNTGNLRHVFVLGTAGAGTGADSKLSRAVEDEARRFDDVIVVGFLDSYRNLTLKVISSLRWLSTSCKRARYVPRHLYPGDTYPPYCRGMAYAGGMTTAQRIVGQSLNVPFFPIEDVYVSMCLQRHPGFGVRNVHGFSNYYSHHPCQGRSSRVPTMHKVSAATMLELWGADCPSSSSSFS